LAVQALRGLATVGVAFACMLTGFLVGVGLAEVTGVVEILMIPAIGGIVVGSLFAQRAANRIIDRIA
jgi:hypothetical protein